MNTVWVCSDSGTPGAATSDTIVTIVGPAGSGGAEGRAEGLDSGTTGLVWLGAAPETRGAQFSSNTGGFRTSWRDGTFCEGLEPGGASAAEDLEPGRASAAEDPEPGGATEA